MATQNTLSSLLAVLSDLQDGQKRFLRNVHTPDSLHALLTFFLFFEELSLTGNVATVALGENVLTNGGDRFAGDDLRPNRRLDRDFKHLPGDQLLHLCR